MEPMSWDICPDHLTPEAMLILQETLNIHSIKDFLTANPQKVAAASLLKVDQVQQIKEIIYKKHCVHVLNCGELVLDPKSRNSSCVKLDLPELEAFSGLSSSLFEPGQIVELFGCPGSGKTQFSILLSVKALKSGKNVIFIDTRNDFCINRLLEMANENFKSSSVSCEGFRMSRTPSISDLTCLLSYLVNLDDCFMSNLGMLIIDNISTLVLPWLQDGQLGTAIREVTRVTSHLRKLMAKHDLAVLIVNNATTAMDEQLRVFKPSLGKVFSNVCDTRIFIENLAKDCDDHQVLKLTLHKSVTSSVGQFCHFMLDRNVIQPVKL